METLVETMLGVANLLEVTLPKVRILLLPPFFKERVPWVDVFLKGDIKRYKFCRRFNYG